MSIRVRNLTKRFDDHAAVDDVSFDVEPGAFFVIVGASGCGKSTLLRLLAGLEAPDAGTIALDGEPVAGPGLHVAPEDRRTGFVFQSYALWPHLSVLENVAFPAEARGATRRDAADQARVQLDTVDMGAQADRRPEALSGGQRQRVALARSLTGGARVILMDEPLANLDPHLRNRMEEELLSFHQHARTTTVYITHDQREALALADQVAVMQGGRFLQIGAPDQVYARPANADVAGFIGRGAVVSADLAGGQATFGGARVGVTAQTGQRDGPVQLFLRPDDVSLTAPGTEGALSARIQSAHYRGAHWEGRVAVDGIDALIEVSSPTRLTPGAELGLIPRNGWVLPG